ncbi:allantoate amidohydrolase [Vibrio sp. CAIM 722]|uniref:Allantoate amidohydrolase n=1 Tax=Vibrio eleionomae TaxID=2653505 RepID=A0A7X4LKD0_9VIBR|nr:allantoate amidohydrolase [Vibrio eleionomae]MZI93380.1 allantoate amidohydrolase [Vibrio eleionomae]
MISTATSAQSIMQRADIMAGFSEDAGRLTRAYLTPEHRQAHDQLAQWMQDAGLDTWQDSVGNQWGRKVSRNPTQPTLVIGSHSDTVTNAGKYDGNLGVLLAIDALSSLKDIEFPFHIDVVAFADEEGTRFNTTLIGSSAVAGGFNPDWLVIKDASGVSIAQAMMEFGLDPNQAGKDARTTDELLGYLEVHIEQGPVLETKNLPVGIVTGIAGAKRFQFQVTGVAGHAGTVPVDLRQDALCGAAEMINFVERYARQAEIVATVGICETVKGAINVIPGETHFTLDVRSSNQETLERSVNEILLGINKIAKSRELSVNSQKVYQAQAVECDSDLQQRWGNVVEQVTQQEPCYLPSGAGHDAMAMAAITPIGMLFVRCDKGISHNPAENVLVEDVDVALSCLINMIKTFHP